MLHISYHQKATRSVDLPPSCEWLAVNAAVGWLPACRVACNYTLPTSYLPPRALLQT